MLGLYQGEPKAPLKMPAEQLQRGQQMLARLAEAFNKGGWKTEAVDDIFAARYNKNLWNCSWGEFGKRCGEKGHSYCTGLTLSCFVPKVWSTPSPERPGLWCVVCDSSMKLDHCRFISVCVRHFAGLHQRGEQALDSAFGAAAVGGAAYAGASFGPGRASRSRGPNREHPQRTSRKKERSSKLKREKKNKLIPPGCVPSFLSHT